MDEEILQIADKDKEKGFRCLIERYQEPLYWHIRRMLPGHDDAEDVLQETFLRVYRHWNSFKGESKLSTWLYKIATNETLRFIEKNRQTLLSLDEMGRESLADVPDESPDDDNRERLALLQKAIRQLPEKQRLVFNLRYYDELDYVDISEILDTQVETLKTNFFYAKENIKKYIQKHYERL